LKIKNLNYLIFSSVILGRSCRAQNRSKTSPFEYFLAAIQLT
jgi:hypothetical protein